MRIKWLFKLLVKEDEDGENLKAEKVCCHVSHGVAEGKTFSAIFLRSHWKLKFLISKSFVKNLEILFIVVATKHLNWAISID